MEWFLETLLENFQETVGGLIDAVPTLRSCVPERCDACSIAWPRSVQTLDQEWVFCHVDPGHTA
jgi:hypothetical protein